MKKIMLRKIIAGMMLGVTTLGAVGVATVSDYVVNSSKINAAEKFTINRSTSTYSIDDVGRWFEYLYRGNGVSVSFKEVGIYEITYTFSEVSDYYLPVHNKKIYNTNKHTETVQVTEPITYILNDLDANSQSDSITVSITVNEVILDNKAPVLETQVFLADVDDPKDVSYILSNYKFHDEVDGDMPITSDMIVTNNYTPNKDKVGKCDIIVSATDEAGNSATGTIQVWVQDKTSPIITGPTTFTSNMSNPLTKDSIITQVSANDNVDGNISNSITVVSDGFTGKENILGNKDIVINVTDSSGNVSVDTTLKVNCIDDIKPTITGTSSYTSSYKVSISDETIKAAINFSDNITSKDDMTLEEISDTYRGNESIPGTYTRVYRVTDSAGNISEVFNVEINVVDQIPPVFMANGLSIGISKAETLTRQELINLLIYMQGLENTNTGVAMLSMGGYNTESINSPGVYTLSYRLVFEDGVAGEVQTATINVLGEDKVVENDEKTQIEQETKNFFQKAWDSIKGFFSNLWKWIVKYIGFGWIWDKENKFDPNW